MENETSTISAKEIQELLKITHQALSRLKWLPECLYRDKKGTRIFDRRMIINSIEEQYGKPEERVYVIEPNRFREERNRMVKDYLTLPINIFYTKNWKSVPNKGDCIHALKLKQNTSRPWIYERRREIVKCPWIIK